MVTLDLELQENKTLQVFQLGLVEYAKSDQLQRTIQRQRQQETIPDSLLLLEHPNVITLGTRGSLNDILAESEVLKQNRVQIVHTDRGGQNTIHAPGQLVGYVIINLYKKRRALRQFICNLEQTLIETLQKFDINAFHHETHTGVWTAQGKIAAIGISVNHGVTRHGFALNVNTTLDIFDWIIPCGVKQGQITSMRQELGTSLDMNHVKECVIDTFIEKKQYNNTIFAVPPGW